MVNGLYLLWKERGPGSQDALYTFKKQLLGSTKNREGIGHTGTLDPFAEGLLLVGVGEGTKLLSALNGLSKSYYAEMVFGFSSATLDDDEELVPWTKPPTIFDGEAFLKNKIGKFKQVPPQFSAVKINGKRAYDLAREGQTVELKERDAEILELSEITLKEEDWKERPCLILSFKVTVTSGTYIRSMARDWGLELFDQVAILRKLIRYKIHNLECTPQASPKKLSISEDLNQLFKTITTDAEGINRLEHGALIAPLQSEISKMENAVLITDDTGRVRALCLNGKLQRVFNADPFL